MASSKQIKEEAMSKVTGLMTALDMYPETSETNTLLSANIAANPIDLLVDFFKSTKGYDTLVDILSKFIATQLPVLEVAVKGILLSNIQAMLSCSIKPIISKEMIREGVVFDMNRIDLFNIFAYSPLDRNQNNPGRYYYFGCDAPDFEILDDVKYSEDFNAVLWYCKNSPAERVVWRRKKDRESDPPYNVQERHIGEHIKWTKQAKSNGIVTLEYSNRSSSLWDCEHLPYYVQEPMENCIHVFFGCTAPINNKELLMQDVAQATANIKSLNNLLKTVDQYYNEVDNWLKVSQTEAIESGISNPELLNSFIADAEADKGRLNQIKDAIYGADGRDIHEALDNVAVHHFANIDRDIIIPPQLFTTSLLHQENQKITAIQAIDEFSESGWPSPESNYYFLHPMVEFNTDFVMSMKLFDEKVVTAQLLDAITNCLKFSPTDGSGIDATGNVGASLNGNINISFQQQFVQAQLRELVTKIIETDESIISDCFFSFTNDTYNALLQEVDMNRAGLQTFDGINASEIPSPASIMSSLNELSNDASKEELQSVIKGSVFQAMSSMNPHDPGTVNYSLNLNTALGFDVTANANLSIVDQLLSKLVYIIVMVIMSPKVYILLMMNLKVVGQSPSFDMNKFMQQFRDLINSLIRGVRDEIMEFFRNEVLTIIKELASQLAVKMTIEQYQYYISLLLKCVQCIKLRRNERDWKQDDVTYADITEASEAINQEC